MFRKVIHMSAECSPNVRYARAEIEAGRVPSNKVLVKGVLTWSEYNVRLATWDPVRQKIGLEGLFWEGANLLMFPPDWLTHSEQLAQSLKGRMRFAKGIGIDPGEGSANTAYCAVDELGVVELMSLKTPNTNVIPSQAINFWRRHNVSPEKVCFDIGGGGKQHVDRLRDMGYPVKTVAFGQPLLPPIHKRMTRTDERIEQREEKSTYTNWRAYTYHILRSLIDPFNNREVSADRGSRTLVFAGFAIPAEYTQLRHQLAPIPMTLDEEGRYYLLPKSKKNPNSKERTLTELIGHSPDEADALVLAIHAMLHEKSTVKAGAL